MGKISDTINHLNTTVRTVLMAIVVGVAGFGGFQLYEAYSGPQRELADKDRQLKQAYADLEDVQGDLAERDKTIGNLRNDLIERDAKIDRLAADLDRVQTAVRLLKLQRRLAKIEVIDQKTDEEGQLATTIRFSEVGDEGQPIGEPADISIEGDRVYVEYLVVKFSDEYVEQADIERGTAICLFERIFGENQKPEDGYTIDKVGSRPKAYERGSVTSEFEQQIWDDFWTIANDRDKAAKLGIRATHAQAPSIRVAPGATYELDLRSTGEFSLQRIE